MPAHADKNMSYRLMPMRIFENICGRAYWTSNLGWKGAAVLYVAGENAASLLKPSVIPGELPKDTLICRPLFALRILTG